MLIRAVAILLLFCSVSLNLSHLAVFAGFGINKSYIIKELCINRNKPKLNCYGKCYLMKKLKQAQEKEQKQENHFQKIQLQEAIVTLPFHFRQYTITDELLRVPLTTGIPVSQINTIFHPPQIGC
jgi:hypothetical protein